MDIPGKPITKVLVLIGSGNVKEELSGHELEGIYRKILKV